MDIYRLLKDELSYELFIRGQSGAGKVVDLRKALAEALREKVVPDEKIYKALPVEKELVVCDSKLKALIELWEVIDDSDQSEVARISSRLMHVKGRLKRIEAPEDLAGKYSEIKAGIHKLEKEISLNKTSTAARETLPGPSGTMFGKESSSLVNLPNTTPANVLPPQQSCASLKSHLQENRDSRIYKWGISYSGEDREKSLCSFLAEVEDRRIARGVSKSELFRSATELLRGTALVWFRAKRDSISSWDELVIKLRQTFLDVDYDHQLMEEIYKRTQGPQESPAIYIAKMQALFSRLSQPSPPREQLSIIARNVKKEYRALLPLTSYNSVEELEDVLNKLEIGATMASRYEEPPSKGTLEPDLAYKGFRTRIVKASPVETKAPFRGRSNFTRFRGNCWNCQTPGHSYKACRAEKKLFCIGCGQQGVVLEKCLKCTPSQGNGASGRA